MAKSRAANSGNKLTGQRICSMTRKSSLRGYLCYAKTTEFAPFFPHTPLPNPTVQAKKVDAAEFSFRNAPLFYLILGITSSLLLVSVV